MCLIFTFHYLGPRCKLGLGQKYKALIPFALCLLFLPPHISLPSLVLCVRPIHYITFLPPHYYLLKKPSSFETFPSTRTSFFSIVTMPSINKSILFLSLALCASALTTPHFNHHRSVAARIATPQEPVIASGGQTLRRRRVNSRCNKKPSSDPAPVVESSNSTSTSKSSTTTSKAAESTPVSLGVNVPSFLKGTQTGQGRPFFKYKLLRNLA